jgi:hypothetical protein
MKDHFRKQFFQPQGNMALKLFYISRLPCERGKSQWDPGTVVANKQVAIRLGIKESLEKVIIGLLPLLVYSQKKPTMIVSAKQLRDIT